MNKRDTATIGWLRKRRVESAEKDMGRAIKALKVTNAAIADQRARIAQAIVDEIDTITAIVSGSSFEGRDFESWRSPVLDLDSARVTAIEQLAALELDRLEREKAVAAARRHWLDQQRAQEAWKDLERELAAEARRAEDAKEEDA